MTEPLKFALVGAGGIAQSYAAAFENNAEARLVAVADVRLEAAEAMAKKVDGQAFSTAEELLAATPDLDAAIICTPPNSHEDLAVLFALRRVHVLCEKPFALTLESARRMARVSLDCKVLLTMGSKFRYVEDMAKAKAFIEAGLLGEVILFENAFTGRVDMSKRWNAVPTISGGGVLIDNGTHSVDIMRYFLGPLAQVHAVEGKRAQGLPVEDTARVFVRSEAGVMGSVDLSWSINKELDWFVTVYGSQGTLQVGWKQSRYKLTGGDWVKFGDGYDKNKAFRNQVNNFAAAIRKREPLRITWKDAVASVEVIEMAYQSMREAPWTGIVYPPDLALTPAPGAFLKEIPAYA